MSDHGTHHHDDENNNEIKSKTAFRSSFWFVLILVGLFIAALNFINIMGDSNEGHKPKEATSNSTLKGETGLGREEEEHATEHSEAAETHDTTAHSEAHH